jgi:alpha-galactosidase
MQSCLERYAGNGHWNDPDMLEVGNGLTHDESVTHMSLWAILAAPLLAGNDLSKMTPDTISVLANKEVIAVDQDVRGKQGHRLSGAGPLDIWARDLSNGDKVIGLFNQGIDAHELHFRAESVGWKRRERAICGSTKTLACFRTTIVSSFRGAARSCFA